MPISSQGAPVHSLRKQIILMLSWEVPGGWWRGAELIKREEKRRAEKEPTQEVWSLVRSYLPTASLPPLCERSQSAMFLRSRVWLERRSFCRPLPRTGGSILKIVSTLLLVLQEIHCYRKLTRSRVFSHATLEENTNGLIPFKSPAADYAKSDNRKWRKSCWGRASQMS